MPVNTLSFAKVYGCGNIASKEIDARGNSFEVQWGGIDTTGVLA